MVSLNKNDDTSVIGVDNIDYFYNNAPGEKLDVLTQINKAGLLTKNSNYATMNAVYRIL